MRGGGTPYSLTNEITSISLESDGWGSNQPGSWHLDKSSKWTGVDTAQINFEVKTNLKYDETRKKDIILVLDISGSMEGTKIERVKEDAKELVEALLSGKGNRVALVVFESSATVASYFVSDNEKDAILNLIDSLYASGGTNYNDALKKLEDVLIHDNYTPNSDTDLISLFLTDGHPCVDTPEEIATYRSLKNKYSYLHVKGIAYETGIIPFALVRISEKQFFANTSSLKNILFEASFSYENYENFQVVDYIEDKYFYIKEVSDVVVSVGTVELINEDNGVQKIVWTLSPDYTTGRSATMLIKLYLKEEYIGDKTKDLYTTNKGEKVKSKLPDEDEEEKEEDSTPVIKRLYDVTYESNAPKGCNGLDILTVEQHQAFEIINMKSKELTCSGYLFKGWEIITEDVQKVTSDTFQMPTKNVTLRAVWSKFSIVKSMEGTFYTRPTLNDIVKSNAIQNDNKYSDKVTDVYNQTEETDIYYYTNKNSNNVLYAGFCWQIVRTTSTGGVKLVYNGAPDANGNCIINMSPERGILGKTGEMIALNTEYWYGESFEWDKNTKTFTLEGNKFKGNYSEDSNKDSYIGKYTCKSIDENNACSTMYYISSVGIDGIYPDLTREELAYVETYTIEDSLHPSWIAVSDFNANEKSLSFTGYMHNIQYISDFVDLRTISIFANDVTWNPSNKQYELSSDTSTSYDDTHHYACNDETCSSVKFIHGRSGYSGGYYIVLENGKKINDALYDMIGYINPDSNNKQPNAKLNKYNSDAKAMIDWWFGKNIQNKQDADGNSYANYLEDVVYCNDRRISDTDLFDSNGSTSTAENHVLYFNNNYITTKSTLECPNVTDQFSVNNTYAKLKYPVGLLTVPEANLMTEDFTNIYVYYWLGSPSYYDGAAFVNVVDPSGNIAQWSVPTAANIGIGLRPVVSLKPGTEFSKGDGTKENPFVVDKPSKKA